MPHEKLQEAVQRRNVLKSSAATVGIGLNPLNLGNIYQNTIETGTVKLVEATVVHEDAPEFPTGHQDDYLRYLVDGERSRLVFTSVARDEMKRTVRQQDVVIRTPERFTTSPETLHKNGGQKHLIRRRGYRVLPGERLSLERKYQPPQISIDVDSDGTAHVSAEGKSHRVAPNDTLEKELGKRKVAVRRRGGTVKEVHDPRAPDQTTKVREQGPTETVTTTPKLYVVNDGALTIHEEG